VNIGTRRPGRKLPLGGAVAIVVLLSLLALGTAAWYDAGVEPVVDQTISVPVPEVPAARPSGEQAK
jgi:hypothetical protein